MIEPLQPERVGRTPRTDKENEAAQEMFVSWAKLHLKPLPSDAGNWNQAYSQLGEMVGDAQMVALGEGVHGAAEILDFRNGFFEYLVRQKAFTAVAIESGLVEGRIVHDFVRGGDGALDDIVLSGLTWTFDRVPQNRALIEWLRDYNEANKQRAINFYGFDLPSSPGNGGADLGLALASAFNFLKALDENAVREIQERLADLPHLFFALDAGDDQPSYGLWTPDQRDRLTKIIADLLALIERSEILLTQAAGRDAFSWGRQLAISAGQLDQWMRCIPLDWRPSANAFPSTDTLFVLECCDVRDRAQADNLAWVLDQEGAGAKIFVFAHQHHLGQESLLREFDTGDGRQVHRHTMAGQYLHQRLGDRVVTIGNPIHGGEIGFDGSSEALAEPSSDTFEALAAHCGVDGFLLDLRTAPPAVRRWLDQPRRTAHSPGRYGFTAKATSFDILLFLKKVSPAGTSGTCSQENLNAQPTRNGA